jgi:hypothetical protein
MTVLTLLDNREICELRTDAFNCQDVDRLVETLAGDVVLRAPGVACGDEADACRDFYRQWFADFPDARLVVRRRHVTGGVAVEEGRFLGTHTGRAATGRRVALDYVQVSCVRDGKQVLLELRFDRLLMLGQLGLVGDVQAAA